MYTAGDFLFRYITQIGVPAVFRMKTSGLEPHILIIEPKLCRFARISGSCLYQHLICLTAVPDNPFISGFRMSAIDEGGCSLPGGRTACQRHSTPSSTRRRRGINYLGIRDYNLWESNSSEIIACSVVSETQTTFGFFARF